MRAIGVGLLGGIGGDTVEPSTVVLGHPSTRRRAT
jgi:hypothetical protein